MAPERKPNVLTVGSARRADRHRSSQPLLSATARLTAGGHLVDVRYRVRALQAVHGAPGTFLVDEASRVKIGPIRHPRDPLAPLSQGGRIHGGIVLFDNRMGIVRAESTVTLVVGDLELHGITVADLMPRRVPRDVDVT